MVTCWGNSPEGGGLGAETMSYDDSLPVDEIVPCVSNSLVESNELVLEMVVLELLIFAFSPSSSLVTAKGSTFGLVINHWCTLWVGSSVLWWASSEEDELQIKIEPLPSSMSAAVVFDAIVFSFSSNFNGSDFEFCWTLAQLLKRPKKYNLVVEIEVKQIKTIWRLYNEQCYTDSRAFLFTKILYEEMQGRGDFAFLDT